MAFWKRGEEGLRQVEALLDAVPDALLVADAAGAVKYANPAALALLGKQRDEVLGQPAGFPMRAGETIEVRLHRPGDERVGEVRVVSMIWRRSSEANREPPLRIDNSAEPNSRIAHGTRLRGMDTYPAAPPDPDPPTS